MSPADPKNGQEKFDSCQFRSPTRVKGPIKICCGRTREVNEYACEKLKVFPLQADKCTECNEYITKTQ